MRMYDIISKKKYGQELSASEIEFAVKGFVRGDIPDYQMSALLMAIYFNGMSIAETVALTMCMADSGDTIDLSSIPGTKVDKHSTGGVGDKTTLAIAPMVASCGVHIAKMSGRGLGHTGGTIDKLESIPGFNTSVTPENFYNIVNRTGLCITGQTGNLAPADKKLYALRDVTATVDCIPLIASSIMSKKLASGADCILLDVKVGTGAFMKSVDSAIELAKIMVSIGCGAGKKVAALVTNMDIPLGNAVGNSLEVIEAVETLNGRGPEDFTEECVSLAANLLSMAGKGDDEYCLKLAKTSIDSGAAFAKLCEMVIAQGGDNKVLLDTSKFKTAPVKHEIVATKNGYISRMNTEAIGISSVMLGAGRVTKDSKIDHLAGIKICKKTGDYINIGDTLAVLYTSDESSISSASAKYLSALTLSDKEPEPMKLLYAKVENDSIIRY